MDTNEKMPAVETRAVDDIAATRNNIYSQTLDSAKAFEPIVHAGHRLELHDIHYEDHKQPKVFTPADQKRAIFRGETTARRLKGTWKLFDDASNELLSEKPTTIAAVPHLYDDGTFILRGNAYSLSHQQRQSAGVYHRRKANGSLEAALNFLPRQGLSHRISMEPSSGVFKMEIQQSSMPLYPILRNLGATHEQIEEAWGKQLADVNASKKDAGVIDKLYAKLVRKPKANDPRTKHAIVADELNGMRLDPFTTKATLGRPHEKLSIDTYLDTTKKLLRIDKGEEDTDDRDHPAYQMTLGPEDLIADRLWKDKTALRKSLWRAVGKKSLDGFQSGIMTPNVIGAITDTGIGSTGEQINSGSNLDQTLRLTKMGEGAISSIDAVPEEARAVQPSYLGFIDPLVSPESLSVGVDMRMGSKTLKGKDRRLYSKFRNVRTGQHEWLSPHDLIDKNVAFMNELQTGAPMVRGISKNRVTFLPREDVHYEHDDMESAFAPSDNLVFARSGMRTHRSAMAQRMFNQALPMVNAESPHVRSADGDGVDFEHKFGVKYGAVRADDYGTVKSVDPDKIVWTNSKGETKTHYLHVWKPNNRKTALHQEPTVRPGQKVTPGHLLARSNQTDHNGDVALGANFRVANMVWKGSVSADTNVLWYSNQGPVFGPVRDVFPSESLMALAADPESLRAGVIRAHGFMAHDSEKLLRIKLSSGRILKATANHSFVVLSPNGNLVEVAGRDLKVGESWIPRLGKVDLPMMCYHIDIKAFGKRGHLRVPLNADFGFLCGMYAAEGCVGQSKFISFACCDRKTQKAVISACRRLFPAFSARVPRSDDQVILYDARLAKWFASNMGKGAQNKKVPNIAFGACEQFRRGFIAGFWTGDGRVSADDKPSDTDTLITSSHLRDGLGLLMASIGISTTHGEYENQDLYTEGWVYRLGVSMRDAHKMPDITPYHTDKGHRLKELIASYKNWGSADHVPIPNDIRKLARSKINKRGFSRNDFCRMEQQLRKGETIRRSDVRTIVGDNNDEPLLRQFLKIADSDFEWDKVEEIEEIDNRYGWVYDFDMKPYRTFICVDTVVVHNSNFEDAYVVSEAAAQRLRSQHMYQHEFEDAKDVVRGKKPFQSLFPGKYSKEVFDRFDDDGVLKPGSIVREGDPLFLAIKRADTPSALLHGRPRRSWVEHPHTWEHETQGVVTDVEKTPRGSLVSIRTEEPAKVGDKITDRNGGKGVIGHIEKNENMPHDKDGRPMEILFNPQGLITRANPNGSAIEMALGKIVAQTGRQPYRIRDWKDTNDYVRFAQDELKKHGLTSSEDLIDPTRGNAIIPRISTGSRFYMKLHHTVESKEQGRGTSGYTNEGMPAKGGFDSAKRTSLLNVGAFLSHGAPSILQDGIINRGQQHPEFWRRFMEGSDNVKAEVPERYKKFIATLQAAGINVVQKDRKAQVMAMTDRDVHALAEDRELKNAETLDWSKDLKPVKGGLFDDNLHGEDGDKWTKISLHEPMPSPVFEEPIRRLLGLTKKDYRDVIAGTHQFMGRTGPDAIRRALDNIDIDKGIAEARAEIAGGRKTKRDDAVRKLGYLKAAKNLDIHPREWTMSAMPVLPAKFRPVSLMSGSNVPLISDANLLYKDLFTANQQLKENSKVLDDVSHERLALYDAMKAVQGLGGPITKKSQEKNARGFMKQITGDAPKRGFVQRKLVGTTADLVGRAVIVPDPDIGMDEYGVPEKMAWEMYKPFVIRHLIKNGLSHLESVKAVEERSEQARRGLMKVLDERPMIVDRAPVLHRYSIMAYKPKIVSGHALHMNPLVYKGYAADNDGDAMHVHVPFSDKAVKDALEKMLPSRNLLSPSTFKAHQVPSNEYLAGLYQATTMRNKNPHKTLESVKEAIAAFHGGRANHDDVVEVTV